MDPASARNDLRRLDVTDDLIDSERNAGLDDHGFLMNGFVPLLSGNSSALSLGPG